MTEPQAEWIERNAEAIAARAPRELEALVAVSSPSGDVHGAEEAAAVAAALAPDEADVERIACSSPDHAPDLLIRVRGSGQRRLLLLGHLDTVVSHADHRPLRREADRLVGSGTIDMKGGDVLALGVLRALAQRQEDFAEASLLFVHDEEWRIGGFAHVPRFHGFDACLCFEGGQHADAGEDAVIVKRKAAATVEVTASGRSAHSGSAPDRGINALLALADTARRVAACHDPRGPDRLTVVPTVMRSGDAFNVVPDRGELIFDVRADTERAFERVVGAVPEDVGGATLQAQLMRVWPGMDSREATAGLLERAGAVIGRPIVAAARGGASDASHFAPSIPLTVDGLGPLGGGAHAAHEFVLASGFKPRAEVALAIADAVLSAA